VLQEAVTEFRILGPLEVVREDGPVALGGQKLRGLLALLLVHAGEVVASERLVTYLWGESPPKTATTSLQNLVSQLRKLLGADAVATKPPGYVLRVEPDRFDLARFERLCAEAKQADDPAERAKLLREALALWRGPALADLAFETFAQGEIRRLEELRLEALEGRIDADLEAGGAGDLVAELESLVDRFPLRERLRGQLMLALYRGGRQADALLCYHAARRTLVDELGIEPSPSLQQIYTSILRQETGLDASAGETSPEDHLTEVVKALVAGRLVSVLGPGANLGSLPDAADVAARLAERFDLPSERGGGLARIAEHAALTHGIGPLYDELHALFDRDHEPGPVHRFLAGVARFLDDQNQPRQLIVTTNFDTALERALEESGVEVDVVSYLALGGSGGKFVHVPPDGAATVIDLPNTYTGLSLEDRTVVLKIHGQVDRGPEREWESFVVAEDDHIDYFAGADIASVVPVTLAAKLRRSHFLFLGYPLEDWSLRVFLHRVWGRDRVAYRSWAVIPSAGRIERELWRQRGIDVVGAPLEEYAAAFERRLAEVST
jgi:DNA-binding SARP family transcriptional activator